MNIFIFMFFFYLRSLALSFCHLRISLVTTESLPLQQIYLFLLNGTNLWCFHHRQMDLVFFGTQMSRERKIEQKQMN